MGVLVGGGWRAFGVAVLAVTATLVTGCTPDPAPTPSPIPTMAAALPWRAVTVPAAGPGRVAIRDVTACAGHWYAVGGYVAADGGTTPAIWSTVDGTDWVSLPARPVSLYGRQSMLSTVACRGGTVVAVGAAAGGAHGNPRTANWIGDPATGLAEQPVGLDLFGGDDAIGVGRLTAGARGFLIGGAWVDRDRQPGAVVWWSAAGAAFTRVDGEPALESGGAGARVLQGVLGRTDGFVAVGSVAPTGSRARRPQVWRSADGTHWSADPVPVPGDDAELQAVAEFSGGLLAAGVLGDGFGAWRDAGTGWRLAGRFGHLGGPALPRVSGLASVAGVGYLVAGDGTRFGLWTSRDGTDWVGSALPVPVSAGADRVVRLAAGDGRLLLAVDDGTTARLWLATPP